MAEIKTHTFVNVSGAIDEKLQPSSVLNSRLLVVNMKFSDVLTQDVLYIRRLDQFDNILEEYAESLYLAPTATNFTLAPPVDTMRLNKGEKIQVVFANNDARILSVPESSIQYEFI